jgi:hypothetical protein
MPRPRAVVDIEELKNRPIVVDRTNGSLITGRSSTAVSFPSLDQAAAEPPPADMTVGTSEHGSL